MKDPKFRYGARVHVHGTPGTGIVVFVEAMSSGRYVYHIEYVDANMIRKIKTAEEYDIIMIDSGEAAP